MNLIAKSDLTTGNKKYASYVTNSNELTFIFTAPYSIHMINDESNSPHPSFSHSNVYKFVADHGLAVRAVAIKVDDSGKLETNFGTHHPNKTIFFRESFPHLHK